MATRVPPHSDDDQSSRVEEGLIDEFRAVSPEERLRKNNRMVRTILQLRHGLARRDSDDGRQG
jgi:hypothetical protein